MRRNYFFYSLLLASALVGCSSSDDVVATDEDVTISDGNPRYMMVNIVNPSGGSYTTSTRADTEFSLGTPTENKVDNVRFYFFNSDGSAANVKSTASGYVNYVDWIRQSDTATDYPVADKSTNNVEDTLAAYIVINTAENDKIPTKMLAVTNFKLSNGTTIFGNNSWSLGLSQLRNLTYDYASLANTNSQFVMVNSVYLASDNERVSTSTIASSNIVEKSGEESDDNVKDRAKANPVNIYVERNVAKVNVSKSSDNSKSVTINSVPVTLYPVMASKGSDGNYSQLELSVQNASSSTSTTSGSSSDGTTKYKYYFLPQGWTLTATTSKAYLSKHIERWSFANWSSTASVAGTDWTDPDNHRSYWGTNVFTGAEETFDNGSTNNSGLVYGKDYNDVKTAFGTPVYTNENAATATLGGARDYPTQVIVAGKLYQTTDDTNFSEASICDYEGTYYASQDDVKSAMAGKITLYMRSGEGTSVKTTKLDAKAFELVTASKLLTSTGGSALSSQESDSRCYVQLGLKNLTWDAAGDGKCTFTYNDGTSDVTYTGYLYAAEESTTPETAAQVREILQGGGKALVYNGGMNYYWFKIPHLAVQDRGSVGVVRNHYYNITADKIVGLGTPVYDPEEDIYPETPVDVDTYIAAKVNILSWKNVEKKINLGE